MDNISKTIHKNSESSENYLAAFVASPKSQKLSHVLASVTIFEGMVARSLLISQLS